MIRYNLRSIILLFSGVAVALALNVPKTSTISSTSVLPCINVSFQDVPDELVDQIPTSLLNGSGLRNRVTNELPAKNMTITRGWPLTYQKQTGFLYEYGEMKSWFGVPIAMGASVTDRFSVVALMANVLLAMCITVLPVATLQAIQNTKRKRDVTMPST